MKKKDFYIGLNGLILVYYTALWLEQPFGLEMFIPFFTKKAPLIIWAIVNIIYWYRIND